MTTVLEGTEVSTLEVAGEIDVAVPDPFRATGEGSLLLFAMKSLGLPGVPTGLDYREALWRVGITLENERAWLVVRCDIDSRIVRALGARVVKYPTRAASFEHADDTWTVRTGEGELRARFFRKEWVEPTAARRTFVIQKGRIWEIPWEEVPARTRHLAHVEISRDTLSSRTYGRPMRWLDVGVAHAGRIHRCGIARPFR